MPTNKQKKRAWVVGVNVTVSPRAHKMLSIACAQEQLTLRAKVNRLLNLPKDA